MLQRVKENKSSTPQGMGTIMITAEQSLGFCPALSTLSMLEVVLNCCMQRVVNQLCVCLAPAWLCLTAAADGSGIDADPLRLPSDEALEFEGMDMEVDLSNLGTVNTMFAALFSKLGVPIKTTISATVLEDALNGTVTVRPLPLGRPASDKVEKQGAHFFGVTITEQQAEAGIVVRVTSPAQSKFKLLYFEQEANGGYGLALQVVS
eukprot:Gb_00051 [translate_table: standard]